MCDVSLIDVRELWFSSCLGFLDALIVFCVYPLYSWMANLYFRCDLSHRDASFYESMNPITHISWNNLHRTRGRIVHHRRIQGMSRGRLDRGRGQEVYFDMLDRVFSQVVYIYWLFGWTFLIVIMLLFIFQNITSMANRKCQMEISSGKMDRGHYSLIWPMHG